jgi:hypothetical protein
MTANTSIKPTVTRRNVIKQRLPGEPARDITLVEVTLPKSRGCPAAHAGRTRRLPSWCGCVSP